MLDREATTLAEALRRRAQADPGRLAFACRGDALSFGELAERAAARGAGLQARGVAPGDRVAVAMSVGLPLVEVFWGLQLIGGVPCVINPRTPEEGLKRRIDLVRPRLVVTDDLAGELDRAHREPGDHTGEPGDLAFLQLTSGTSGDPRASMIQQQNILAYLGLSRSAAFLGSDDVLVGWVPPWHDLGLVRFVIGPLFEGGPCHLIEPAVRTIPEWLKTISEVGGTYSAAPDFALRIAARMVDPASVDLTCLRFMKSGGEPVSRSTIDTFEARFGLSGVTVPGYGLGEATLGVSEHLPGEDVPVDERGNVSCGPVNPGLEVRIAGTPNQPGEILVRGPSVFAGYFEAPEQTARTLRDGWLHTGDTGYFDAAGRLFVLGRREGMIKRAGAVVAPRELEDAAMRVSAVQVAAATSVGDARSESVIIAIELRTGVDRQDEIAAEVSQEITRAVGFAPHRVAVVERRAIPRTENGKIRHGRLRELLESGAI